MHDGAPAHRTITVRDVLASHNIPVLDWPGNLPDFNPIENAWQIMKNKIHVQATNECQGVTGASKEDMG